MFNLNQASTGLKKAAALKGIKFGNWEPIFNSTDVAKVIGQSGESHTITAAEVKHASGLTWREIRR